MKPGIAALSPNGRAIVRAVRRAKAGKIIIQTPGPFHGRDVEDPGATARLIDGHRPVESVVRPIGPWIAAEVLGRWKIVGTDRILVADRIQLTPVCNKRLIPSVIVSGEVWRQRVATGCWSRPMKMRNLRVEQDLQASWRGIIGPRVVPFDTDKAG